MCGNSSLLLSDFIECLFLFTVEMKHQKRKKKKRITKSFPLSDISSQGRGGGERWNNTYFSVDKWKGEKLTDKKTGLSTSHDGGKYSSSLLRLSAPSQEAKDGGPGSCSDSWGQTYQTMIYYMHWVLTVLRNACVHECACVTCYNPTA